MAIFFLFLAISAWSLSSQPTLVRLELSGGASTAHVDARERLYYPYNNAVRTGARLDEVILVPDHVNRISSDGTRLAMGYYVSKITDLDLNVLSRVSAKNVRSIDPDLRIGISVDHSRLPYRNEVTNLQTQEVIRTFETDDLIHYSFTKGGRFVFTSDQRSDGTHGILVRSVAMPETSKFYPNLVNSVVNGWRVGEDRHLFYDTQLKSVIELDFNTGFIVPKLIVSNPSQVGMQVFPDGQRLLVVTHDYLLTTYSLVDGSVIERQTSNFSFQNIVLRSNDAIIFTRGFLGTRIHRLRSGGSPELLLTTFGSQPVIGYHPSGNELVRSGGTLLLEDVSANRGLWVNTAIKNATSAAFFEGHGYLVASSQGLRLVERESGRILRSRPTLTQTRVFPGVGLAANWNGQNIELVRAPSLRTIDVIKPLFSGVLRMAISSNGRYLAYQNLPLVASELSSIVCHDLKGGTVATYVEPNGTFGPFIFSEDGTRLLAWRGDGQTLVELSLPDLSVRRSERLGANIRAFALGPGQSYVVVDDGNMTLIDSTTWRPLTQPFPLPRFDSWLISPDRRQMVLQLPDGNEATYNLPSLGP